MNQSKLEVFNINTYSNCKIEAKNHQREFICIFPKGDAFKFKVDIDKISFKACFECTYYNENHQDVVLYRAEPTSHVHEFWIELGHEYYKRTKGNQDDVREKVLKEFNFDWEGDTEIDY